jgi:hypothetical protein
MQPSLRWDPFAVALICVTFWVLGSVTSFMLGGVLHIFLVLGISIMVPRVIWGRKRAD